MAIQLNIILWIRMVVYMVLLAFVLKMVDIWRWCRIRKDALKCGNGLGNQQNGTTKLRHGSDFLTMHISGAKNAIKKFVTKFNIIFNQKTLFYNLLYYSFHVFFILNNVSNNLYSTYLIKKIKNLNKKRIDTNECNDAR